MTDVESAKRLIAQATHNVTKDQLILKAPMELLREGVKFGLMAAGKNVDGFDNKTLKLFSPRFMALTKEDDNDVNLISPSVFSMHDDGMV